MARDPGDPSQAVPPANGHLRVRNLRPRHRVSCPGRAPLANVWKTPADQGSLWRGVGQVSSRPQRRSLAPAQRAFGLSTVGQPLPRPQRRSASSGCSTTTIGLSNTSRRDISVEAICPTAKASICSCPRRSTAPHQAASKSSGVNWASSRRSRSKPLRETPTSRACSAPGTAAR